MTCNDNNIISLAVDKLDLGMVLAQDVKDRSGRMLLGAGCEVTDKTKKIFKTWGIQSVNIVNQSDDVGQAIIASSVDEDNSKNQSDDRQKTEQARLDTDKLFKFSDRSQPFIEVLYQVIFARIASGEQVSEEQIRRGGNDNA